MPVVSSIQKQSINIISLLSLIGIFDTIYLLDLHYSSSGVCLGETKSLGYLVIDCGKVASSKYSELFGIPIAFFGFLYYLSIFILRNYEQTFSRLFEGKLGIKVSMVTLVMVSVGFIISMYLLYLQLVVLKLICTYCMLSILTTTLLLIIHVIETNK